MPQVGKGPQSSGLSIFPGYAQYPPRCQGKSNERTLAPAQLGAWLLANFATVKRSGPASRTWMHGPRMKSALLGEVPQVHFKCRIASGKSIVIEPRRLAQLPGAWDNPHPGFSTNSPTFPGNSPTSPIS